MLTVLLIILVLLFLSGGWYFGANRVAVVPTNPAAGVVQQSGQPVQTVEQGAPVAAPFAYNWGYGSVGLILLIVLLLLLFGNVL